MTIQWRCFKAGSRLVGWNRTVFGPDQSNPTRRYGDQVLYALILFGRYYGFLVEK